MTDVLAPSAQDTLTPLDSELGPDQASKKLNIGMILGRQPVDEAQLDEVYLTLEDLGVGETDGLYMMDMDEETGYIPRLEVVKSGVFRDPRVSRRIEHVTVGQILQTWNSRGGSPTKPLVVTFEGAVMGGKGARRYLNLVPTEDSEDKLLHDVGKLEEGVRARSSRRVSLKRNPFVFPVAFVDFKRSYSDQDEASAAAEAEANRILEKLSPAAYGQVGSFAVMGYQISPSMRVAGGMR